MGLDASLRVDSALLPSFTLGSGSTGGTASSSSAGGLVPALLRIVKPSVTVELQGEDAYTIAPFGDPSPAALFPLLIAGTLLVPLGIFAAGWALGEHFGRRGSP